MKTIEIVMMSATILTIIAAFLSLRYSVLQFKEQLRLNFFADYTKRYQEIMLQLPFEIGNPDFDIHLLDHGKKEHLLKYMRAYFDLCSEEYHQFQKGHVDKDTWKEWEEGIKDSFSKRAFLDASEMQVINIRYYKEFTYFIENCIKLKEI